MRREPAAAQTGWDCVHPEDTTSLAGCTRGNGGAEMNKILYARITWPLREDKRGRRWAEWTAPATPTGDRDQELLKGCVLLLYLLTPEFPRRDLKQYGGCCGSGPSNLRNMSLLNWPNVEGRSKFIDMTPAGIPLIGRCGVEDHYTGEESQATPSRKLEQTLSPRL